MSFSASFQKPKLNVTFGSTSITASTGTPVIRELVGAPLYDGAYTVTPKAWEDQSLPTAQRILQRDVTVFEIPYYETSNLSGGSTVYIGSEVELDA